MTRESFYLSLLFYSVILIVFVTLYHSLIQTWSSLCLSYSSLSTTRLTTSSNTNRHGLENRTPPEQNWRVEHSEHNWNIEPFEQIWETEPPEQRMPHKRETASSSSSSLPPAPRAPSPTKKPDVKKPDYKSLEAAKSVAEELVKQSKRRPTHPDPEVEAKIQKEREYRRWCKEHPDELLQEVLRVNPHLSLSKHIDPDAVLLVLSSSWSLVLS